MPQPPRFHLLANVTFAAALASCIATSARAQTFVPSPTTGSDLFRSPRSTISNAGVGIGTLIAEEESRAAWWSPTNPGSTPLPTTGFTETFATMMGDNGVAIGYGLTTSGSTALRWDTLTSPTPLAPLSPSANGGDVDARANAVNAAGIAVGFSEIFDTETDDPLGTRATLWNAGSSSVVALPFATNSSGFGSAQARAVSDSGFIAGDGIVYDADAAKGTRGALWNADGALVKNLDALSLNAAGEGSVEVTGVNVSGSVIGNSRLYEGSTDLGLRAVRWDGDSSTPTLLGTLGTTATGANVDTTAIAIDPNGNIAGLSQKYEGGAAKGSRPVVWLAGTTTPLELEILGTASNGATRGNLSAMNSFGFIAGTIQSYNPNGSNIGRQAVVWDLSGAIYNLNELVSSDPAYAGWFLTIATDITDTGWVTGVGTFDPDPANGSTTDQYERYFSLQSDVFAIPEPSTAAMLLIGGFSALLGRRRRR